MERLSRLYSPAVLWEMVYGDNLFVEQMTDEAQVQAHAPVLAGRVADLALERCVRGSAGDGPNSAQVAEVFRATDG